LIMMRVGLEDLLELLILLRMRIVGGGAEPAPIPSPKRALSYQTPRVIGQSSSHETTDMPAQQSFSEGASA
ncbi:hypothetical protein NPIL_476161, partial [Nephila pilipes]